MANERYITPQDATYVSPSTGARPLTFWDIIQKAEMPVNGIVYDPEFHTGATAIGPGPASDNYLATVEQYMRPAARDVVNGISSAYTNASNALGSAFDALVSPEARAEAQQYYQGISQEEPLISATGALADLAGAAAGPGADVLRASVADPLNLVTLPAGALRLYGPVNDAYNAAKYSPLGYDVRNRIGDVINGHTQTVYVPNRSRAGSSGDLIWRAGQDAVDASRGVTRFSLPPVEAHAGNYARSLNGGNIAVGDGNHRVSQDLALGVQTAYEDNDLLHAMPDGTVWIGHKAAPQWEGLAPEYMSYAHPSMVMSGARPVRVKPMVDSRLISPELADKMAFDRAQAALKYGRNTELEQQLYDMSRGEGYKYRDQDPHKNPSHAFTGLFSDSRFDHAKQQYIPGINPFIGMDAATASKSPNAWVRWLGRKYETGELGKAAGMPDAYFEEIISALQDPKASAATMRLLEPVVQKDLDLYLQKNKIKVRPQQKLPKK